MKKVLFLAAAIALTATMNAQNMPAFLKSEIKLNKEAESALKEVNRVDRKVLRKLKGDEVSYQSKQAFISDFGNIPVSQWERLDNFDEATFTKGGQVMSAFYDYDSKLVGTTQNKTFTDLPAKAQKYIREKYKGYTPADVILFDDNEMNETDMVLFGSQFDDTDSYFVELKKDNKKIVVQVSMGGDVSYYTRMR
jgi:hypothetical protein